MTPDSSNTLIERFLGAGCAAGPIALLGLEGAVLTEVAVLEARASGG